MKKNHPLRKSGFTLIELLVVISIIALLVAILMPALNKAREQATGANCLANQKTLIAAWVMFATEHDDWLVGGSSTHAPGRPEHKDRWVENPKGLERYNGDGFILMDDYKTAADLGAATVEESREWRYNGIRSGRLYEYIRAVESYNCPGDKRWRKLDPPYDAYRSYSIQGMMRGADMVNEGACGEPGVEAYTRFTQIRSPAEKYVFVEEAHEGQPFLINSWVFRLGNSNGPVLEDGAFWDPIAIWHNKRSTFAFADGHADMRNWEDERTYEGLGHHAVGRGDGYELAHEPDLNPDYVFLWRGYGGVGR